MNSYPLGPASWPVRVRKLLPYCRRFARGASAHDWLYELGGDEFERKMADLEFLELCLEDSETLTQAVCAFLYFLVVRWR